jgi:RecA/RadA recombinase
MEQQLQEIQFKVKNNIKLSKDEKVILKANDSEAKAKKKSMSFGERMKSACKAEHCQLMGDDYLDLFPIRDWISTGNVLLNSQISSYADRGIPSGRVVQFNGDAGVGKTFLGLECLKSAQKMGYFGIIYDSEMANNDRKTLKSRGIDTNNLLYIPIDTVESLKTSLLNIIEEATADDKIFILVDSIGNLSTRKELEDSIEGSTTKDMTRPAQLKALFRTCTIKAGVKNIPIIVINHQYASMSFMGGSNRAGGGGPEYNSSIINTFSKAQEKAADGTITGGLITSTLNKCRTAKERTKIKFSIDFENGLTKYSGLELFCKDEKLIEGDKKGWAFTKKTGFKQGQEKSKLTPEIWEEFLETYLGEYLHNKFAYQSVYDEINGEEEEDDDSIE